MIFNIGLSIFAIAFCLSSFQIIGLRRKEKIAVGFGQSQTLERFIGAARNLFEYSIIFLLLINALEKSEVNPTFLAILLIIFIIARAFHYLSLTRIEPQAIAQNKQNYYYRISSMITTFLMIFVAAITLIITLIVKNFNIL